MSRLKAIAAFAAAGMSAALAGAAAAAPVPAWTGPYIGVNAGYGWGDTDWSDIMVPSEPDQNFSPTFSSSDPSGVIGGAQVGYTFQFDRMVAGVEGAISIGSLDDSDVCFGSPDYGDYRADCRTDVNWVADLTARVGFAPMDEMLIYFKGGATFADVDFHPANEVRDGGGGTATGGYSKSGENRTGFILAVGAEYMVSSNVTVGVEFAHRDYGTHKVSFNPTGTQNFANPPFSADTSLKLNSIVARLNYRF